MGTPATLRERAARLTAVAYAVDDALRPVVAATGPAVWRGPAAQRFDDELAWHAVRLRDAVARLLAQAAALRREAARLESLDPAA